MTLDIEFQTGLMWQDLQHDEWIAIYRELETAKANEQDQALFDRLISFLVMYVHHHFSLEAEYMLQYDYPEKRFHLEEHRLYTLRLKDLRAKHREYSKDAVLSVIEQMSDWIYAHIMENDKKLGRFILDTEKALYIQRYDRDQ